jgi:hypothetical protein
MLAGTIAFAQPDDDLGEIYSIGIRSRLNKLPRKMVFVADTVTDNEFSMSTRQCTKMFKKSFYYTDSPGNRTINNLDSFNKSLKNIFDHYKPVRLISAKENDRLFAGGVSEGWSNFYKRYPGYAGIIFLSPVYFNQSHTSAIYQLSLASQPCAVGRNSLIFLGKDENGKWHESMPVKMKN